MAKTDKERKEERAKRILEKAKRVPLNDTILQVQNGTIDIKDLFTRIGAKVKGGKQNGQTMRKRCS